MPKELEIPNRVVFEIKTSRSGEETVESMVQFLTTLTSLRYRFAILWKKGIPISLEIAVLESVIHFYISCPPQYQVFIESQLLAQYPKALMTKVKDYLPQILEADKPASTRGEPESRRVVSLGQLRLTHPYIYPLRVEKDFKEIDPLSSVLSILSKAKEGDGVAIQYLLLPVSSKWQSAGRHAADSKTTDSTGASSSNPYAHLITEKVSSAGFKVAIRLVSSAPTKERARELLSEIAGSFASFTNPSGNGLTLKRPMIWQKSRLLSVIKDRDKRFMPRNQFLNVHELATLFHFPNMKLATIQNISWHKTILSEPPSALPVAEGVSEEEKNTINFFAKTEFRNKMQSFGIKQKDRRRHMYVIGKTGAGKSTLIANMAISDMRNNRGFCIVDPHGDLCETILDYVPSYRVNDVIYFDPSDPGYAFSLNPIEVTEEHQKELVVSGIIGIFKKIYGLSWGPRLEYILRQTLFTIIEIPDATLMMIPQILTEDAFRAKAITYIKDPVLLSFWNNEFANMTDKLRVESISPILNKVGQFLSSKYIRNIVSQPKSSLDLQKVMDEGKILLLNLSQGKLGEDNAALMGAMIITKIQLSAMNRVMQAEDDRRDFYLYVDEFQNFATTSFVKILSEARKYRLDLILANQYIAQVPEEVRSAIFGNAGTVLSFLIGAEDSRYIVREFGDRFKEEDLLALGNHQAIVKLAIDNITQSPFMAYTLPLPNSITQNREKVIRNSRERYARKLEE